MKTKLFYAGAISVGVSIALLLLDLTKIKVSFSDTSVSTMTVYPVAFFALLGLLLIYHGLKPLWRNK
jgi:predicted membrane channel-forming protein YqfA (hemolysin III family)